MEGRGGDLNFPVSCGAQIQPRFDAALAASAHGFWRVFGRDDENRQIYGVGDFGDGFEHFTLKNFPAFGIDEMHDTLKIKFSSEWQSIEINERQIGLQTVNSTARMNTKEFEVYARVAKHLKWFLTNKKKHIQWQKRLQALIDEYIDILSVE